MKNIIFLLLVFLVGFIACKKDSEITSYKLNLGDTTEIKINETLKNEENNISIQMDSVLNDSRCPSDCECFWAGNAEVRFIFKLENEEIRFTLNTYLTPKDYITNGYQISLLDLIPYPISMESISQNEYYAKMMIQKK